MNVPMEQMTVTLMPDVQTTQDPTNVIVETVMKEMANTVKVRVSMATKLNRPSCLIGL